MEASAGYSLITILTVSAVGIVTLLIFVLLIRKLNSAILAKNGTSFRLAIAVNLFAFLIFACVQFYLLQWITNLFTGFGFGYGLGLAAAICAAGAIAGAIFTAYSSKSLFK